MLESREIWGRMRRPKLGASSSATNPRACTPALRSRTSSPASQFRQYSENMPISAGPDTCASNSLIIAKVKSLCCHSYLNINLICVAKHPLLMFIREKRRLNVKVSLQMASTYLENNVATGVIQICPLRTLAMLDSQKFKVI